MSTGISHFSICSLPPVRTRLHNVLPYAHGPSPSCAHRAGFWGFEQAAAPPVRGFPGFAFRLRSRAAKSAKQEPPSEFIRLDVHAVKAGINLRSSRPLITPVRKQKSPPRPLELSLHNRPPSSRRLALAPPRPSSHCIYCPLRIIAPLGVAPMRACAGPEPGSSMPHGAQGVCRACRPRDSNGNAAQTGGLARQVRQRMNRLGKPEHRARFCFFSKKKPLAGTRRFPIPSETKFGWALTAALSIPAAPKPFFNRRP